MSLKNPTFRYYNFLNFPRDIMFFTNYSKKIDSKDILSKNVAPTRTLFFCSMPCEQRAALIRNNAVIDINNGMSNGNLERIAYRYLQSRFGAEKTWHEAKMNASFSFMLLAFILMINSSCPEGDLAHTKLNISNVLIGSLLLVLLGSIPPALANSRRYQETELVSFDMLTQLISDEGCKKIETLSYFSKIYYDKYKRGVVQKIVAESEDKLALVY